jgi:anaerobic C4-dicarboxylate transporter
MISEFACGITLSASAGGLLYLSGAKQRITRRRLSPVPTGVAALALVMVAAWLLMHDLGTGSAIFTLLTVILTILTVAPFMALLLPPSPPSRSDRD